MKKAKTVLSVIAFTLLLAVTIGFTFAVFNVKSVDQWPSTRVVTGFYEEAENTLDVLYMGTSHTMCGCSPMTIYEDTGITGYSLATERQYLGLTWFWVQEAFKYQSPKLVVLDAMSIFSWAFSDLESRQHKALDYMRFSETKIAAVEALHQFDPSTNKMSYFVPFLTYHSRWNDLSTSDFTFLFEDKTNVAKGYYVCYEAGRQEEDEDFSFFPSEGKHKTLSAETLRYLDLIIDYCKDHGAEVLLVEFPRATQWSYEKNWTTSKLAEEREISFIDFNTPEMIEAINFNLYNDMYDPWHCSGFGAEKVSHWLGDYISRNYQFSPHSQEVTDLWDAQSQEFDEMVQQDKKDRFYSWLAAQNEEAEEE